MRSDERRELLGLLRKHEGMSKAQAQAYIEQATEKSLSAALVKLRSLERVSLPAMSLPATSNSSGLPGSKRLKKVPYTLLMHPEHLEALKAIADQDASSVSHHIRQAIRSYLRAYKP